MPDDVRIQAEFDRLMSSARANRMRGDYGRAAEDIRRVLKLRPEDLDAREFAADMLMVAGKDEQAAEEYKRILEEDKSRASAEEKYAKAVLHIAEQRRQRDLLNQMLEEPGKYRTPPRNPALAALLSAAAPGLGHAYCGQYVKGAVFFVSAMVSWLLFYASSPSVPDYSGLAPRVREVVTTGGFLCRFVQELSAPAVLFLCVTAILYIYALVNAVNAAEKTRKDTSEPE